MSVFTVPPYLIVNETEHWLVNHRVDTVLPGYLIAGSKKETTDPANLAPSALAELGPLLASAHRAITDSLHPEHIYIGRYGHQLGHSLHFHIIPIYTWVKEAFAADARYDVLKSFYSAGVLNSDFDGAELTLFVWREFCESQMPRHIHGPSVAEAVVTLKRGMSQAK